MIHDNFYSIEGDNLNILVSRPPVMKPHTNIARNNILQVILTCYDARTPVKEPDVQCQCKHINTKGKINSLFSLVVHEAK